MNIHKLRHQLLVATPSLQDRLFSNSVVYVFSHSTTGSQGFILNKLLPTPSSTLLTQLNIPLPDNINLLPPLQLGGPLKQQQAYLLSPTLTASHHRRGPIHVNVHKQAFQQLSDIKQQEDILISLGYASWSAGQLEQEILANDWLIAPYNQTIVFNTPINQRHTKAIELLGIHSHQLTKACGHA